MLLPWLYSPGDAVKASPGLLKTDRTYGIGKNQFSGGEYEPFMNEYRSKLTTAEKAVKVVESGNNVFYGEFVLFPWALDSALADRIEELKDVEIRGTCFTRLPKVVEKDPEGKHAIVE
jgi:hypothetical protein